MQPLVGVIADRSTSKWGRRRPFMVAGSLVVGLCLFVLGWTKEIVSVFVSDPQLVCILRIAYFSCIMRLELLWNKLSIRDIAGLSCCTQTNLGTEKVSNDNRCCLEHICS